MLLPHFSQTRSSASASASASTPKCKIQAKAKRGEGSSASCASFHLRSRICAFFSHFFFFSFFFIFFLPFNVTGCKICPSSSSSAPPNQFTNSPKLRPSKSGPITFRGSRPEPIQSGPKQNQGSLYPLPKKTEITRLGSTVRSPSLEGRPFTGQTT